MSWWNYFCNRSAKAEPTENLWNRRNMHRGMSQILHEAIRHASVVGAVVHCSSLDFFWQKTQQKGDHFRLSKDPFGRGRTWSRKDGSMCRANEGQPVEGADSWPEGGMLMRLPGVSIQVAFRLANM